MVPVGSSSFAVSLDERLGHCFDRRRSASTNSARSGASRLLSGEPSGEPRDANADERPTLLVWERVGRVKAWPRGPREGGVGDLGYLSLGRL